MGTAGAEREVGACGVEATEGGVGAGETVPACTRAPATAMRRFRPESAACARAFATTSGMYLREEEGVRLGCET